MCDRMVPTGSHICRARSAADVRSCTDGDPAPEIVSIDELLHVRSRLTIVRRCPGIATA